VLPASGLETTSAPVEISVVVPTYKAEGCLRALHERLSATLVAMGKTYELIFVEDCGPDNSWSVLKSLADSDERVTAYKLSKNFGQQMAITAGLSRAEGNWIVVMDCDLQDPPELIEKLYAHAKLGHDIVFAKRKQRTHSQFRRFVSRFYFAIVNALSQTHAGGDYGAFTLISREVKESYLRFSDVNRHYLMILFWLGFETSEVEYEQEERYAGKSSYSLLSLLKLATEGVFFQTTILLKLIVLLGFLVSIAGVLIAVWAAAEYFLQGALPGWTSLTVLILLLGGISLTSHGIVGLYVGEIFDQVKQRPLFVIARAHGVKSRRESPPS
jgi:dolichol-phosphate mannosyltransferase